MNSSKQRENIEKFDLKIALIQTFASHEYICIYFVIGQRYQLIMWTYNRVYKANFLIRMFLPLSRLDSFFLGYWLGLLSWRTDSA